MSACPSISDTTFGCMFCSSSSVNGAVAQIVESQVPGSNVVGYDSGGERTLHVLPLTFPGGNPQVG
jgi:hypothetical protein